ncbi:MAG: glycosyltransferase family 39 protein [Caldimicrobium sp.]|nr:glycosyltransferase family 39 protein [Caldimicrobium sp.]MDW8183556.1 glycosyltransferase family 39 protein [Caldimicrobium sp.]
MFRDFKRKYFVDYLLSGGGLFLLALFVGKFYYLVELPLSLSYDESYYWDWSRALDWGYYSKPPMIAWLIYLSTKYLGNTEWAVRLPALLCNTFALALGYVLMSRHFGFSAGRLFLFTLAFTPIFWVYSFVMTIDPPLILFWMLSFYGLVNFITNPSCLWAILTGISIGLGMLTKQTMFVFIPLGLIYLYLFDKNLLWNFRTLVIPLIALLIYLPNLVWNIEKGFVLFVHTAEHFGKTSLSLKYYLSFFGGLFILFGVFFVPLFLSLGFKLFSFILRQYLNMAKKPSEKEEGSGLKVLLLAYVFSFPPLVLLFLLAFFKVINHNWIMPFFLTSYLWVSYLAMGSRRRRLLLYVNLFISLSLSLVISHLPKKPNLLPFGGDKPVIEIFYKFMGWRELSEEVKRWYDGTLPLLTSHREIASSLAFYLPEHPHPYVLNLENKINNQYHLWRSDAELQGKEVFLVKKHLDEPPYLREAKKLGEVILKVGKKEKVYSLWKGIFIKGGER